MKHLIILFTAFTLLACNKTEFEKIQGEWTIIEFYDNYQDYTSHLNSSNNIIEFTEEEIPLFSGEIFYLLRQDGGCMGNQNMYILEEGIISDNWGPRFTVEWINNNKVKLVSLIHTGRHIIIVR